MRRRSAAAVLVVAAAPILAGAVILGASAPPAGNAASSGSPTSTATIETRTLKAQTKVSGMLGYDGEVAVVNGVATSASDPATAAAAFAQARSQYDTAVSNRDDLGKPPAVQMASARAGLAQANAALLAAQQSASGPTPAQLSQARAQLSQAQAGLASAQKAIAGPSAAQLATARAQLAQAQAGLVAAQNAAAGPNPAQLAQAQAAVTSATTSLSNLQAAAAAAQSALTACQAAAPGSCDPVALGLAAGEAQGRVTDAQAQLTAALAALSALNSPAEQAQAQANLVSAQAAVQSAQAALDALTAGTSPQQQADLATAQAAVESAQAGLDALTNHDGAQAAAQLAAARASVQSAQATLHDLVHPTAAQRTAAADAVAVAKAQLDSAKAALTAPHGVVTQVAAVGTVVKPGEALYTLDDSHPVILLDGTTPAWRAMGPGMTDGIDVRQLESNLAALGFGGSDLVVDEHWDTATTVAVKGWQRSLHVSETGTIVAGAVVFADGAVRVTDVALEAGQTAGPTTPVLAGTSTRRVVTLDLNTSAESIVHVGDKVDILLPDTTTTTGTIATVGAVATVPQNGGSPTIPVTIILDDPAATGSLDQAPVSVAITTATASNVLAVPVEALVALLEGGYAIELDQGGTHSYIGVTLGLFANGWVEVSGNGLAAGQTVVVPR